MGTRAGRFLKQNARLSEVKWNLYARRQPVKSTGENKNTMYTLMPFRWPWYDWAQKNRNTNCGMRLDHRLVCIFIGAIPLFRTAQTERLRAMPMNWMPMRNTSYPLVNGALSKMRRQCPIRTTANSIPFSMSSTRAKCATRWFQTCKISCHASLQSMYGGRPKVDRQNFRKWMSKVYRCSW